jgi:thiol-disulfide isomerase/thioredoxin
MKRRDWVLIGAGSAAAAAGLGWQLWRSPADAPASGPTAGPAPDEAATAFWQSSFTQPDGQPLALAALRGTPLVLNFWATWCPPCVKEMPELDRFAKAFAARGGRVLGLAVDNPTAVRQFLARSPVGYTIGLAGFEGTELSRKLGNATGALPFTAVFSRSGAVVQRKLGETSFDELMGWSKDL